MNMLTIEQYKQYTYYKFHFNNHRVLFTFVFNIEKKNLLLLYQTFSSRDYSSLIIVIITLGRMLTIIRRENWL